MLVEHHVLGDLQTNCWIVQDEVNGPLVVIDPAAEAERLLRALADRPVSQVVLTHSHFDHLGAASAVLDATHAPLLIHELDAQRVTSAGADGTGAAIFGYSDTAPAPDRILSDGDTIVSGELLLEVLHTPGHTKGGICLLGKGHLFSGDTLFAGSVGRTDFPGGDAAELQRSIGTKLATLPDETVVHPGHGPETTIGRERRINPFFPRA